MPAQRLSPTSAATSQAPKATKTRLAEGLSKVVLNWSYAHAFLFMTFQPYWLSVFLTPVILRWMFLHTQTARARRQPGIVIFPATALVLLCLGSLVLACCIVIGGWKQDDRWITTAAGLAWAAFSLWIWPTTIVLNGTALTAKHIWRPTRSIP